MDNTPEITTTPSAAPADILTQARVDAKAALDAEKRAWRTPYAVAPPGQSASRRMKWLSRLPDGYAFETDEYRWALSPEQRAALPPAVEGPRAELTETTPPLPPAKTARILPFKKPTPKLRSTP